MSLKNLAVPIGSENSDSSCGSGFSGRSYGSCSSLASDGSDNSAGSDGSDSLGSSDESDNSCGSGGSGISVVSGAVLIPQFIVSFPGLFTLVGVMTLYTATETFSFFHVGLSFNMSRLFEAQDSNLHTTRASRFVLQAVNLLAFNLVSDLYVCRLSSFCIAHCFIKGCLLSFE